MHYLQLSEEAMPIQSGTAASKDDMEDSFSRHGATAKNESDVYKASQEKKRNEAGNYGLYFGHLRHKEVVFLILLQRSHEAVRRSL